MKIQASRLPLVAALAIWCVHVVHTLVPTIQSRKWSIFSANMTQVLCRNFTEIFVSDISLCIIHAATNPWNNLACFQASRCIMSSLFVLPRGEPQDSDGFTCFTSYACLYGDRVLQEGEVIAVPDLCEGTRNMVCSRQGIVYTDAPPRREACTEPFTQYKFGCMYLPGNHVGNYCVSRDFCEALGSEIASPETHEDAMAMTDHFTQLYQGRTMIRLGLQKLNGVWRWPSNMRDPGPKGTGDWHKYQPDPSGSIGMMWDHGDRRYSIGDYFMDKVFPVLCHVWNVPTGCP